MGRHVLSCDATGAGYLWSSVNRVRPSFVGNARIGNGLHHRLRPKLSVAYSVSIPRGGDTTENPKDDERYSRQVFTLGKRAHDLIRSSTIYLDGPTSSGLMYEVAKNLALSGVQHLVIVESSNPPEEEVLSSRYLLEQNYHDAELDDLGQAYMRAAREETGNREGGNLMVEYIRRLNPTIQVSLTDRENALNPGRENFTGVLIAIDRPLESQKLLNIRARDMGLCFVSVETAGVYGRVLCDFGEGFEVVDADGEPALVTPLDNVENGDGNLIVRCVHGEKHDVSQGDTIEFLDRQGKSLDTSFSVINVLTPFSFVLRDSLGDEKEDELKKIEQYAVSFQRIKTTQKVDFHPISTVLQQDGASLYTPCDFEKSFDEERRSSIQLCFQHLEEFVRDTGRLPSPDDTDRISASINIAGINLTHVGNFVRSCRAKFAPLQAIFGAISAQESLKAITKMYSPIRQILHYDCDEIFASETVEPSHSSSDDDAIFNKGLNYLLGQDRVEKMQRERIFVVGAGAIGCEILKNLAAMGVACKGQGKVILTDMDTIEKSNLSRQLLFRDEDIGAFKSEAAHRATQRFNPNIRIESHSSRVGGFIDSPFDFDFWQTGMDIVLNALDNVDARLFMDRQCVENGKPLIDAGTLGPKGNVQVVIPFLTESYGSSVDPPDESIPVCTLKNFPYSISHTIQWGRDMFDGLFRIRPDQVNKLLDQYESVDTMKLLESHFDELGEEARKTSTIEIQADSSFLLKSLTADGRDELISSSIDWAVHLATEFYRYAIESLLKQHPVDSLDEDGNKFWSGSRRAPQSIVYSLNPKTEEGALINENLESFVLHAARLRLRLVGKQDSEIEKRQVVKALASSPMGASSDHKVDESPSTWTREEIEECLNRINKKGTAHRLLPIEFEKDDSSNGHVAFITAASNLRAICYGIPPSDELETRKIAGRIVPAMITTTAFVSALSCVEFVKTSHKTCMGRHKNAFINLALPFFAFTNPMPAERIDGLRGRHYTLWDRLAIKEKSKDLDKGGIQLKRLLARIKRKAGVDPSAISVSSISYGPFLLYADFLHGDDKEVLRSTLWDLISEAVDSSNDEFTGRSSSETEPGINFSDEQPFVDLTVVVEDLESGDEVELPPVRVFRK